LEFYLACMYFFSICFCTNYFLKSSKMGMISLIVIHVSIKDHTHCVLFIMLITSYDRCLYTWILAWYWQGKVNPSHAMGVWMQIFALGYPSLRFVFKKLVKPQKIAKKKWTLKAIATKFMLFYKYVFWKTTWKSL